MSKLIVSLSPHAHGTDSVERNMYGVIIALIPALLVSFFYFGIGSAIVCLTSVLACVLFEWAINKFILGRQENTVLDGSAALTGLLLGMNLPSNLPIWIIVIGALFAIGVGKMTFGGLGNNIFNPALVGRCVLLVAFPAQMTSWPKPGHLLEYTDAATGATPLAVMKQAIQNGDANVLNQLPDAFSLLLGDYSIGGGAGTIGEICGLALIAGLLFMLWRKIITWSGGLLLGAIFMATDYVTSPMTPKGQIIYGVCIGLLTIIIRNWGAYPEGMSFAILIMNAFTPLINNYVKPKRFGEEPAKK